MWKVLLGIFLINGCFVVETFSQIVVQGKITDNAQNPIENVSIQIQRTHFGTTSNKKGEFSIKLPSNKSYTLVVSHLNFKTKYKTINIAGKNDTVSVNIQLTPKVNVLNPVEISAANEPVPVFRSTKLNVADFQFFEDKYVMISYEKRLNKNPFLVLTNNNEKIIDKRMITDVPKELYVNVSGQLFLICQSKAYIINVVNNTLFLEIIKKDIIDQYVKPMVDKLHENVILSDFVEQFPNFKYYLFNSFDSSYIPIKEITDELIDNHYHMEYYKLSNADKQFAKRMAKKLGGGLDKYDIAAAMTGYTNDFLFEPLYAPLCVLNDTINIFDFHADTLYQYIKDTIQVGAVPISFHHPKKWKEWKKQLLVDREQNKVYGVFLKDGYYILKQISPATGKIILEKKLTHRYAEKIKIKDGFVYYIYKPSQTLQKKFLYKEKIITD